MGFLLSGVFMLYTYIVIKKYSHVAGTTKLIGRTIIERSNIASVYQTDNYICITTIAGLKHEARLDVDAMTFNQLVQSIHNCYGGFV